MKKAYGSEKMSGNLLTDRAAVLEFCKSLGEEVYEDYPFNDGNWAVMRHRSNKKGFAFLYEHLGHLQVNVKCAPEWTGFWRGSFESVLPAYHMNKTHWNTIILDGSVPDSDVKEMISESFRLTANGRDKKATSK